jgi:hypothetical protein
MTPLEKAFHLVNLPVVNLGKLYRCGFLDEDDVDTWCYIHDIQARKTVEVMGTFVVYDERAEETLRRGGFKTVKG